MLKSWCQQTLARSFGAYVSHPWTDLPRSPTLSTLSYSPLDLKEATPLVADSLEPQLYTIREDEYIYGWTRQFTELRADWMPLERVRFHCRIYYVTRVVSCLYTRYNTTLWYWEELRHIPIPCRETVHLAVRSWVAAGLWFHCQARLESIMPRASDCAVHYQALFTRLLLCSQLIPCYFPHAMPNLLHYVNI